MEHLTEEEILSKYLESIPASSYSGPLFVIGFIGLNGSGKSHLAYKLGEEFNIFVATNDRIRRFLNDLGFEGESPRQDLVEKISTATTDYLFSHGLSHIIDADLIKFHKSAEKRAHEKDAKFYLIHVKAKEEDILRRLENRTDQHFSQVGAEEYFKRKELHQTLGIPPVFYTFNSSSDFDPQWEELVRLLRQDLSL